mmetsp:Transcript_66713/g.135288  ORF Transcript_66713/g.135288 Transcript_66713/m.135288 type:complete len:215 (+) Transcript_66713:1220-1864(+)
MSTSSSASGGHGYDLRGTTGGLATVGSDGAAARRGWTPLCRALVRMEKYGRAGAGIGAAAVELRRVPVPMACTSSNTYGVIRSAGSDMRSHSGPLKNSERCDGSWKAGNVPRPAACTVSKKVHDEVCRAEKGRCADTTNGCPRPVFAVSNSEPRPSTIAAMGVVGWQLAIGRASALLLALVWGGEPMGVGALRGVLSQRVAEPSTSFNGKSNAH